MTMETFENFCREFGVSDGWLNDMSNPRNSDDKEKTYNFVADALTSSFQNAMKDSDGLISEAMAASSGALLIICECFKIKLERIDDPRAKKLHQRFELKYREVSDRSDPIECLIGSMNMIRTVDRFNSISSVEVKMKTESACHQCTKPNDIGINKCWYCECPNPC